MQELESATHTNDLPREKFYTWNIDYQQMGVGGDTSWGARTHPEYTIPSRPANYAFILRPVRQQELR
jgi:beta-galactosidase